MTYDRPVRRFTIMLKNVVLQTYCTLWDLQLSATSAGRLLGAAQKHFFKPIHNFLQHRWTPRMSLFKVTDILSFLTETSLQLENGLFSNQIRMMKSHESLYTIETLFLQILTQKLGYCGVNAILNCTVIYQIDQILQMR